LRAIQPCAISWITIENRRIGKIYSVSKHDPLKENQIPPLSGMNWFNVTKKRGAIQARYELGMLAGTRVMIFGVLLP